MANISLTNLSPQKKSTPFSAKLKNKGLFIKTYGCQMNNYDSQKMAELLSDSHGLVAVDSVEEAEVALMNTCSVREKAQEKIFTQLGQWRQWKEQNRNRILAVAGCVAAQEGKNIHQRAPFVDIIIGPQTLHRLPSLIDQTIQEKNLNSTKNSLKIDIDFPEIEKFDNLPQARAEGVSAYISIMEGCSKYCSFCIVPYTRGEEFSRSYDSIIKETHTLAEQGVREIVLLGQNVNAYHYQVDSTESYDFAKLISNVATIPGIDRLRFTTSHPIEMTDRLIDCFGTVPELAPQIHLPVQSGSDHILTKMKRGYTVLEYKHIIKKLRSVCPDIRLSSDFIIGFPGESEEDFEATYRLIEELVFDQSYSFIYSSRPGTPAASLADNVPLDVKKERLYRIQRLLTKQSRETAQQLLGTHQTVLVERLSKKDTNEVAGRAANNLTVNFAGDVDLIGQMVPIVITEAYTNSLKGERLITTH